MSSSTANCSRSTALLWRRRPIRRFITVLDPHQENVVLHPDPYARVSRSARSQARPSLNLDIPTDSLSDYAYVLVSQDPLHSPLQADPKVLQAATQKAQNSGGAYETPLAYAEIAAYNEQGQPMSLSKAITSRSPRAAPRLAGRAGLPIRAANAFALDLGFDARLWVKMPDSRPDGSGVSGSVTQFSV